jgi:hypothetical protein
VEHDTIKRPIVDDKDVKKRDANRDPITGAPGAHPVGTGIGAAAGGIAAGAAAGTVAAGPIGTIAGAAVGAIVGGLAGKAAAEHFDPTAEEAYWRENYTQEPYYRNSMSFDEYSPAYRLGGEARYRFPDQTFEDVEDDLARDYEDVRGQSRLEWQEARDAARAAWTRLDPETRGAR